MHCRLGCAAARRMGRELKRPTSSLQARTPTSSPQARSAAVVTSPGALLSSSGRRNYASVASPVPLSSLRLPDDYVPPTKPPTARPSDARKAQLLRSYTALLRSYPLLLFFQHDNLTAVEWAAIRRELRQALSQLPTAEESSASASASASVDMGSAIRVEVLRTRIFDVALQIVEFFRPEQAAKGSNKYTHDLGKTAYESVKAADKNNPNSQYAQISPLFSGHVAVVSFPHVSPAHLETVLKILAPSPPKFPAPTRRKSPGYYEPIAQSGLQKLILLGGRIENQVFDNAGVKWVASIEGGVDGLRSQLVGLLQSAGMMLTTALEGNSKTLWLTLEGRRTQLEVEQGGGDKKGAEGGDK